MSSRAVIAVARPRTPTPAEVEAAGAWEALQPSTLVLDFQDANPAPQQVPGGPGWAVGAGGLKEAILKWLEEQM